MRKYIKHNFKSIKKIIIVLAIILSFNLSAFAIIENDNKIKISLEEAMGLALDGNIELQKQRKDLGISKNNIAVANALKNPQIQSNLLIGKIATGNSSQIGVMLPIEIAKRKVRKDSAKSNLSVTENQIRDSEFKLKQKVRSAYFNLILAKSNLKIMEDRKDLLEDLLEIAENHSKNSPDYEVELLQADMRLKKTTCTS